MLSFLSVETCLSPVTATICQVLSFLVYDHQIQSTRLNWIIGLEITYEVYLILIIILGQLQVRVNIICLHVRWQITFTILIHLWSYSVEIVSNFFYAFLATFTYDGFSHFNLLLVKSGIYLSFSKNFRRRLKNDHFF